MLDHVEQKIVDDVGSTGWSIMAVAPRAESDDPEEWFAYTIGLQKTFGWPEIICFGQATDMMARMLNHAVEELRERHLEPVAGIELTEVLDDYPTRLTPNKNIPFNYLGFANWFAGHAGMANLPERLQLVWPDMDGRFPDDPNCNPDVVELQTPLGTGR